MRLPTHTLLGQHITTGMNPLQLCDLESPNENSASHKQRFCARLARCSSMAGIDFAPSVHSHAMSCLSSQSFRQIS